MGSTPAIARGGLTILAGGKPTAEVESVLSLLGDTLVFSGAAEAAALKLVANGVLGDSVSVPAPGPGPGRGPRTAARRPARRARSRGARAVRRRTARRAGRRRAPGRDVRRRCAGQGPRAAGCSERHQTRGRGRRSAPCWTQAPSAPTTTSRCWRPPAQDLSWLADARLDVSPEVVADPAVLRPLHAYALAHATGDPSYLAEAFLPTAHIEGYRDGEYSSWDLESFAGVFSGSPATDEETRSRRVERLDVPGAVATATLTLHHGEVDFTDVFVLVRRPDGAVADRQQGLRAPLSCASRPVELRLGPVECAWSEPGTRRHARPARRRNSTGEAPRLATEQPTRQGSTSSRRFTGAAAG